MAEFVYPSKVEIPRDRLREVLRTTLPHADIIGEDTVLVTHQDHPLEVADGGTAYACTAILVPEDGATPKEFKSALAHSRHWPTASDAVIRAKYPILVTEMFAGWCDPIDRIRMFHGVVSGLAQVTEPALVHCIHADRLVNPASLSAPLSAELWAHEMPLFFNIRHLRPPGEGTREFLMDTRGLAELGLPDLQIHCHDLSPSLVAGFLWNLASYILKNGDCIENGHTVEGLEPGQRWRCQHEDAIVKPHRVVLDVNPGPPFAAGNRKN